MVLAFCVLCTLASAASPLNPALMQLSSKAQVEARLARNTEIILADLASETEAMFDTAHLRTLLTEEGKGVLDRDPKQLEQKHFTTARQALQNQLLATAMTDAMAWANQFEGKPPMLWALRGNTASGKTTTIKTYDALKTAVQATASNDFRGVNPDTFKEKLITEDLKTTPGLSNAQVHMEGSMLAKIHLTKLWGKKLKGQPIAILIDQRLGEMTKIQALWSSCQASERGFSMVDIEAPLMVTVAGVFQRKDSGVDPLPPFEAFAQGGYVPSITERVRVIALFTDSIKASGSYVVFSTNIARNNIEVATVTGGTLTKKNAALYTQIVPPDGKTAALAECARVGAIVIGSSGNDPTSICAPMDPRFRECCVKALTPWSGMAIEAAIDAYASKGRNAGNPNFDAQKAQHC